MPTLPQPTWRIITVLGRSVVHGDWRASLEAMCADGWALHQSILNRGGERTPDRFTVTQINSGRAVMGRITIEAAQALFRSLRKHHPDFSESLASSRTLPTAWHRWWHLAKCCEPCGECPDVPLFLPVVVLDERRKS